MQFLIGIWIPDSWKRWRCRLMMLPTIDFLFLFCWKRRVSWWKIWISLLVETFRFLIFFFLFVPLLWDFCFLLAKESFSSFLCLSRIIGFCSPLSLFSPSCTWLNLSPESLSMIKISSSVQYGVLMGFLKILKRRYLLYDDLSSFCIS